MYLSENTTILMFNLVSWITLFMNVNTFQEVVGEPSILDVVDEVREIDAL